MKISKPSSRSELMKGLNLKHNPTFRNNYIRPALESGYILMTDPDSPNSPEQRYILSEKGIALKKAIEND